MMESHGGLGDSPSADYDDSPLDGGRGNNFKVVIRVRPPLPRELNGSTPFQNVVSVDKSARIITICEDAEALMNQDDQNAGGYCSHVFTFDHVYDLHCNQRQV